MGAAGDKPDQPVHRQHLLLEDTGGGTAVLCSDDKDIRAVMNDFRQPDKPLLFRHMIDIRHHGRNRMHQVIRIVRMVGVRVIRSLMAVYLRGCFLERGEGFIPDGLDEALHGASGGITFLRNLIDAHVRNAAEVLQKELCEHHIDVAFIVGIENRKKRRPRIEPYGIVFSVFPGFLHTYMYIII